MAYSLSVLFPAILNSTLLFAQWSTDPNLNNPISTAANSQHDPIIVSDGADGAIITWTDLRSGTDHDIYAQRINGSGVVQWTANGVAISTAPNDQASPTIASDGADGAIITWTDLRSGTDYDIYAQRINGSGAVQWTADGVAICTATNEQLYPTIVSDGAGGAIITWYDFRSGSFSDIYAQRINAAGQVMWQANGFPISTAANGQTGPTIASDGGGGAIITWYDYRSGGADIYAQRIDATGVVQWTTDGVAISTAANNQINPAILSDGAGGAIITWLDVRSGTSGDIYAQRTNGAGVVQWAANGVAISTAAGSQLDPIIVSDGADGAIITWTDYGGPLEYDIYAQRINGSGAVQWTADGVAICTATNEQLYPTIVGDGAGGAIITWLDARSGTSGDIYAQRTNGAGVVQWAANGVAICTAGNQQRSPTIVNDGAGGAIITWYDFRNGSFSDIYVQKVDRHGYLGFANPSLTAVRDVAGDQGGQVTVAWDRSYLDASPRQVVAYYSIWRGIEFSATPAQAAFIKPEELTANFTGKAYRRIVTPQASTNWELAGTMISHYFPSYSFTTPTLSDSSASGTPYFKFLVSAHTANQFVFWDSNIDSGYSTDNLPPLAPLNVVGNAVGSTVALHWNRNQEADLAGYEVYRSRMPNFDPDTMAAYATTSDTAFTDIDGQQGNSYYALRAIDIHSNQSPKSNEVAILLVGVEEKRTMPTAYALHQNYPNPLNPSTTIDFSIPREEWIVLRVFNALGEEVAELFNETKPAGSYSVLFNASGLTSGVYFYNMSADDFSQTRKMILLR